MCGIVAIAGGHGTVSVRVVESAIRTLSHRGPDDRRTWLSPSASVGLGHARLSIIDLETGGQPLANEDGSIHAVVNGEFYGFKAIREDLQKRGHVLRTRSDSEILIHLYEDSGFDCLRQLRGEFAFVLWDERNQVLFAARDRFGIKPLFYAEVGECLYLASEAKALLAAGVPAKWDREVFFQSTQGLVPPDRCLFQGVYQLPAGQYLAAKDGRRRIHTYWDFNYPLAASLQTGRDEDYVAELRRELDEAVRIRLCADVPVGVYLSGGIDSSAVLGMASRHIPKLDAFSVFFPEDPAHNEEARIRESSRIEGVNLHSINVTSDLVVDNFAAAVAQWEDLPKSEWVVGKYLLSRFVRDLGTKVVLTGEGSDEVFAGHMALAQDNKSGAVVVPQGQAMASEEPLDSVRRVLGFIPTQLMFRDLAGRKIRPFLSPDFAAEVSRINPFMDFLNFIDRHGQLEGRERLSQSLYIWSKTMLPNFFLTACGDRSEMAHSVEGRVPFLDHRVVELARGMPSSVKVRGGVTKYVLREAVRDCVTDAVYRSRKQDFVSQRSRIAKPDSRMGTYLQDTLRGPSLSRNPFFDRQAVLALLDELKTGDAAQAHQWDAVLLNILGSCVLQDTYHL